MKTSIFITVVVVLVTLGWWLASSEDRSKRSYETRTSHPPTTTLTDPASVFQKAFWKRPTPEDQILHAERREWKGKDGVSKWQWFIAVKPSPSLVNHLIADNAFMLTAVPVSDISEQTAAPKWFPPPKETAVVLTNTTGTFRLFWDKENNLLHATDSGSGFGPGAPEPARVVTVTQPEGRLPTTPPPRP